MLETNDVIATIAVKDLKRAGKFYEQTLGLQPGESRPGAGSYSSGRSKLFVYESQFAGTNQATAATWVVDDIEAVVRDLAGRGVRFEHYDFPGTARKGDIHVFGDVKNAWFKDPDGNILSIVSR
jgi:catechol 2,3-dioxygenase-like lactoylglutathione lyase family enzyme